MIHELFQGQREEIILKFAEFLNLSSDEYLLKVMQDVSIEYAKGYLDAFLANARDEDMRMFYQFVKTINMV